MRMQYELQKDLIFNKYGISIEMIRRCIIAFTDIYNEEILRMKVIELNSCINNLSKNNKES